MTEKKHVPVPKDTKAYTCANCGAVALDANNICKVEGKRLKDLIIALYLPASTQVSLQGKGHFQVKKGVSN